MRRGPWLELFPESTAHGDHLHPLTSGEGPGLTVPLQGCFENKTNSNYGCSSCLLETRKRQRSRRREASHAPGMVPWPPPQSEVLWQGPTLGPHSPPLGACQDLDLGSASVLGPSAVEGNAPVSCAPEVTAGAGAEPVDCLSSPTKLWIRSWHYISWPWWYRTVIPTLGRQRKEDQSSR